MGNYPPPRIDKEKMAELAASWEVIIRFPKQGSTVWLSSEVVLFSIGTEDPELIYPRVAWRESDAAMKTVRDHMLQESKALLDVISQRRAED